MAEDPKNSSNAGAGEEKKKKKRVIVTPPCPAAVSTGYLILRGVLQSFVGASMDEAAVSLLQPTYIKEKVPSGKFSVNFGKKLGSCELDLPEEKEAIDKFWKAFQTALDRTIADDLPLVTCASLPKDQALEQYGNGILNGGILKKTPDPLPFCSYLDGIVLAVPPSAPYATTGCIKAIVLDLAQCNITAGKKARKADITIKFKVEEKNGDTDASAPAPAEIVSPDSLSEAITSEGLSSLRENKIRMDEGRLLVTSAAESEAEKNEQLGTETDEGAPKSGDEMVVTAYEVELVVLN